MLEIFFSPLVVAFNIVILSALFVLLIVEEVRMRHMKEYIETTRGALSLQSDELISRMTTIRKYISSMQSGEFGKSSVAQVEALNQVEVAAGHLFVGFGKLLAASRIEDKNLTPHEIELDLNDALHTVINAVSNSNPKRKDDITFHPLSQKALIHADPTLIHGMFDELVFNAMYYSQPGDEIHVRVLKTAQKIKVEIEDSGMGIPKEDQEHIFHRSFRGSNAKDTLEGNGLGLFFVSRLLDKLGGTIQFKSKENKGTTFTVTLPKKRKKKTS